MLPSGYGLYLKALTPRFILPSLKQDSQASIFALIGRLPLAMNITKLRHFIFI